MTEQAPQRRSIWEKMAAKKEAATGLADVDFDFSDESTSTFRIEHTGELVIDTAASLATSVDAGQVLGELDLGMGSAYHLLALPPDRSGEEVEALAISVWNEAGWINPGVLHLTEGVTLEGPWEVAPETREELGLSQGTDSVWLLRSQAVRGAAPTEEIKARDELARAFPEGMPVGVELNAISVMRRIARRLGGEVRVAGSGQLLTPESESAVNLSVYTSEPLSEDDLRRALEEIFGQVQAVTSENPDGDSGPLPHAMLVELESGAQVLVGMRPVEELPRALRWEPWIRGQVYLYEVNWANSFQHVLPSGLITRAGRRQQADASRAINQAAAAISAATRNVAVIDEDDFLVAPEELLPPEEVPEG